jgi:hypothetical protein
LPVPNVGDADGRVHGGGELLPLSRVVDRVEAYIFNNILGKICSGNTFTILRQKPLTFTLQAVFAMNPLGLSTAVLANAWESREAAHIHGTALGRRL